MEEVHLKRFTWLAGSMESRWFWLISAICSLVLTFWAYQPALDAGFVFDDQQNIQDSPALHIDSLSWDKLKLIMNASALKWRVVANVSFAVNHIFSGMDPAAYHLTNVVIHIGTGMALALLIWFYLRRLADTNENGWLWAAMLIPAVLFLLHPLNTQAVTYVVQRMASLAAMLTIFSMVLYFAGRSAQGPGRALLWFTAAAVCWLLALGSKENVLVLPLVILTYEWCFHPSFTGHLSAGATSVTKQGTVLITVVLVVLLGIAAAGLLIYYTGGGNPFHLLEPWPDRDFNGLERMLTQARVHWYYFSLLILPLSSRLNLDHDFSVSRSLMEPVSTVPALLGLLLLLVVILYLARRRPEFGFPLLAYFEFHFIESGAPLNLELIFEHRMYLPMTMLALALAVVIYKLRGNTRLLICIASIIVALLFATATHTRNETWSDYLTLNYDIVSKSPLKARAHHNLGLALFQLQRYGEAEAAFRRAIELDPVKWKPHMMLGEIYLAQNQPQLAMEEFRQADKLNTGNVYPAYAIGLALEQQGNKKEAVDYYLHLGTRLGMAGQTYEAMIPLRRALAIAPNNSGVRNSLGNVYLMAGKLEDALEQYRSAVAADKNNFEALYNLASLSDKLGRVDDAIRYYQDFIQVKSPRFAGYVRKAQERLTFLQRGSELIRLGKINGM